MLENVESIKFDVKITTTLLNFISFNKKELETHL